MLSGLRLVLTFATLAVPISAGANITFCSDTRCKEEPLGTLHLNSVSECRRDFSGQALGIKIRPTNSENHQKQAVRFYRSTDCFGHCGSGHLIFQTDNGFLSLAGPHPLTPAPVMQSFELVDLDEKGEYPAHGYCGIRHGDAQFFRGRTWRWQQIGASVFREVPIEGWDDTLHPQQSSGDYDLHGSVFDDGRTKYHQISDNVAVGVPLEEWDEDVHYRNSGLTEDEMEE